MNQLLSSERVLSVSLAAIEPNISGVYWLKLKVENKIIWFKIINRIENQINCIVSEEKKLLFKKSLNSELVERGLAVVKPYDKQFDGNKSYKNLYKNLILSQTKAQKRNCGVWQTTTKWEAFKNKLDVILDSVKRFKNFI